MSTLSEKKFPIGKFHWGKSYDEKQLKEFIKDIELLPRKLEKAVKKLSGEELDLPYRPGGWTARQVVHHLADSHMNSYIRMKLAVTENNPTIKPYDENRWAETHDGSNASVKVSLRLLDALHERWAVFLRSLGPKDFKKTFHHPGLGRDITLSEALALYSWHSRHHTAHVKLVSGWEPKTADGTEESASAPAPDAKTPKKRGPKPAAEKAAARPKKAASADDGPKLSTSERMKLYWAERRKNQPAKSAAKSTGAGTKKRGPKADPEKAAAKAAKAAETAGLSRSERMKLAWVERRKTQPAKPAKPAKAAKAPKPAKSAKDGPEISRSERMKMYWAERNKDKPAKPAKPAKVKAPKKEKMAKSTRTPEEIKLQRQQNIQKALAAKAAKALAEGRVPKAAAPKISAEEKAARAAARAAKKAAKANKPVRSPEEIKAQRQVNIQKALAARAAKAAAEGRVPKKAAPKVSAEEKAAKAAARAAKKAANAKPVRSPEEIKLQRQENIRKALAAKAAKALAEGRVPKPKAPAGPKLSPDELAAFRLASLAKARAARGLKPAAPKVEKPKLSPEELKASRVAAMAKARAARKK